MDDFGSIDLCRKCRKRRPDEEETELILRTTRTVGQTEPEKYPRAQGFDYCVCLGCAPEIPEWAYDDLATRLVLCLQYPPEQFREMYRLVVKHWRKTEPMGDDKVRKEMQHLRQKGQLVFAKKSDGKWYAIQNLSSSYPAFDAVQRSYLKNLENTGHLLSYNSWKFLQQKRPNRNKMNLPLSVIESKIIKDLNATLEKACHSPHDFPFMSSLANPPFLLDWRCLRSPGYFLYVFARTAGGLRSRRVAFDPALVEQLRLGPRLILLALTTIIHIPVWMFWTHVADRLDPHWYHLQSFILLFSRHRSLAFILIFGEVLLPAYLALVIAFFLICWAWCTWAAMLLLSVSANPLVETDPTLRQKLRSWFRLSCHGPRQQRLNRN